jgi:hypothetical protein
LAPKGGKRLPTVWMTSLHFNIVGSFPVCSFQKEKNMIEVRGKKKDVGISTAQTDFSFDATEKLALDRSMAKLNKNHPKY